LVVRSAEKDELGKYLRATKGFDPTQPFLLVCPGARHPIREYPPSRLATALRQIVRRRRIPLVIAGSSDDDRTTRPLMTYLDDISAVFNLAGCMSLRQHVVLTSMAEAVLTMESSTAHIAGALGRPAVVLIGGGHSGVFGPWGQSDTFRWLQHRIPCYGCAWECVRDYPACIHDIAAEAIATNVLEILAAR
jgi:ADP-heptose:LPS heptosyltransferase